MKTKEAESRREAGSHGGTGQTGSGMEQQGPAGSSEPLKSGGRWSVNRKKEIVLRLLRGESVDVVSREVGVTIFRLEQWREEGLAGLESGLKKRKSSPEQVQLDEAMKRVGELTMENELLWKRVGGKPGPLARRRSSR